MTPPPARTLLRALTAGALAGALALAATPGPAGAVPAGADADPTAAPVLAARGGGAAVQGALDDGARTTSFNNGWKFRLVNPADTTDPTGAYADAQAPGFDDSQWRSVDLPHDWSIELDPTPTGTTADAGYYQGGLGWYRKSFTLPAAVADKALSVEFDGVYMDSHVYVNGQEAAAHPYGYTGFKVDLTGKVHTDGTPNVIAVKVQNKLPSSRWYSGSGIYRNTHLVVTDKVHVARWGTYVTTPDLENTVTKGYGDVHAEVTVDNESGTAAPVTVVNTVRDAAGRTVARDESKTDVTDHATVAQDLRVDHPELWSTTSPALYSLHTEVVQGDAVLDSYDTRFGFRWYRIDPQSGFSLNGKALKVQGVDLHHDLGSLGSAVSTDAIERQLRTMRSMGVNALRTSHNPPAPEVMKLCDELGIVTMVEAFDTWRSPKRTYDYGRFFDEWSDRDIKEMVNANRNSPSVILWSIGNEIPDSTNTRGIPMAQRLIADIKEQDKTRPVTIGSDKYRSVPSNGSAQDQIARLLDGVGLNYNTAKSVDALHAKYPDKFFYESESSSETSARGVYQDPNLLNTGENYTPGKRLTSSYDNNLASWTMSGEYGLKKDRDRPYFMGQFLWAGIDYIGEPTPYDVFPVKGGFWGAVDSALFPKDMYYLFRSQWTTKPMVHLVPMNWTDHKAGDEVQVWAYSNVDTVELFLNGKSLGTRTFDHKTTSDGRSYLETSESPGDDKTFTSGSYTSPNGGTGKLHLTWKVPFEKGVLRAVATRGGKVVADDQVSTAGDAATTRATPEKHVVSSGGQSLAFIDVDVVDAKGVTVPSASDKLRVTVDGGRLVGLDNGRQESAENYKATSMHAFNGKLLAIVRPDGRPGPVTVTVTGDGLAPSTATVHVADSHSSAPMVVDPVRVRAPQGSRVDLPARVDVIHGDGTVESRPVSWKGVAGVENGGRLGVHQVNGVVDGMNGTSGQCCRTVKAEVTVWKDDHVEPVEVTSPTGFLPALPGKVRVVGTDGVVRLASVSWQRGPVDRYASAGDVPVTGSIEGISVPAKATVHAKAAAPEENVARAGGSAQPSADAGFSGGPKTLPAAMLDGTSTSGGWSSYYNKSATALLPAVSAAHPSEWVSVDWAKGQGLTGSVKAYFTTDANRQLPADVVVSAWDGTKYVPVGHQQVAWAGASNQPTTITFDPVATTSLRLDMTSKAPWTSTGFLQIAELEVAGHPVG